MPVDTKLLEQSMASISKIYGKGGDVHTGASQPIVERIPFTSPSLNFATGGGIPMGRISRFYGGFSSGKSLTVWDVIKNAQALDLLCAYYNIEKQFEPVFTASQGVELEKLLVVEGTQIEEIGTKLEQMMKSVHVHALDSCSSAVSVDELGADITDWSMGLAARVWGKVLRRTLERLDIQEHSIILVDQIRDVFGGRGDQVHPPGGRYIEHTSSLTIFFRKSGWLFRDKNTGRLGDKDELAGKMDNKSLSGATEPAGIEIVAQVQKSRVGRPFRSARLRYDFGTDLEGETVNSGLDITWEIDKAAKHFGLISAGGGFYKRTDGEKFADGSNSLRGRDTWLEYLESNEAADLRSEIIQNMVEAGGAS